MNPADRLNEGPDRPRALMQLNEVLGRKGIEAFYAEDNHCYLRHGRVLVDHAFIVAGGEITKAARN